MTAAPCAASAGAGAKADPPQSAPFLCVINAAEGSLDIILGNEQGALCAQSWSAPTRGAEILTPALGDMLTRLRLRPAQIGRMACVRGPGSFTGVRLALTTAAALRRVCGTALAGLDYMQALALRGQRGAAHALNSGGQIWALTHARRDLVHCQPFMRAGQVVQEGQDAQKNLAGEGAQNVPCGHEGCVGQADMPPVPLAAVELCSPAEAVRRMGAAPPGSVMLGSGVQRNAVALADAGLQMLADTQPQPRDLWTLAHCAAYADADIEPLYIRPCDAVDILSASAHARLEELLQAPVEA